MSLVESTVYDLPILMAGTGYAGTVNYVDDLHTCVHMYVHFECMYSVYRCTINEDRVSTFISSIES